MMTASPFASTRPSAAGQLYRQVAVDSDIGGGADPHRLVALLFDGLFESIAEGRGAMRRGDVEAKGKALTRAAAIVEEGLRASLDVRGGGQLALDLRDLYAYVTLRLTHANLAWDETALDECVHLMQPLAEAWTSIRPRPAEA